MASFKTDHVGLWGASRSLVQVLLQLMERILDQYVLKGNSDRKEPHDVRSRGQTSSFLETSRLWSDGRRTEEVGPQDKRYI